LAFHTRFSRVFRPLLSGATISTPAISTPAIWCRDFYSRDFSVPLLATYSQRFFQRHRASCQISRDWMPFHSQSSASSFCTHEFNNLSGNKIARENVCRFSMSHDQFLVGRCEKKSVV